MRRLRIIEERFDLTEGRINNLQNTVLKSNEGNQSQSKKISDEIKILEERILKIENNMIKLSKGLEGTAKESDMKHLQKLVELYSPFKNKSE